MNTRWLKAIGSSVCIVALSAACAHAQHGGGNPGGGPPPPGMPGGPGGGAGGPGTGGPGGPGGGPGGAPPRQNGQGTHGTANGNAQSGPVGRWWDNKTVIKSVGISPDQKKKMDSIFDANKPAILASYKNFLKEQARLESISKDPQADKSQTFAAIDAVNQARADLQKAAAQMYLQIKQQMDQEQIEKLEKLQQ